MFDNYTTLSAKEYDLVESLVTTNYIKALLLLHSTTTADIIMNGLFVNLYPERETLVDFALAHSYSNEEYSESGFKKLTYQMYVTFGRLDILLINYKDINKTYIDILKDPSKLKFDASFYTKAQQELGGVK